LLWLGGVVTVGRWCVAAGCDGQGGSGESGGVTTAVE
nr:hypothetical protein [Tanacetum cinerariifolium]